MQVTMQESKFGVPVGLYRAKFIGVQAMPAGNPPRLGRDGKPMGDGLEWQFEVVADGSGQPSQYAGKISSVITGTTPTAMNLYGKTILPGLMGRAVQVGENVDVDTFIGRVYQIGVGLNREGKARLNAIYALGLSGDPPHLQPTVPGVRQPPGANPSQAQAAPPAANAQRAPTPTPPPRSPRPAQAAPPAQLPPEPSFWVQVGDSEPVLMSKADAQAAVNVASEPVSIMPEDQSGGWKDAAEMGLKQHVPF